MIRSSTTADGYLADAGSEEEADGFDEEQSQYEDDGSDTIVEDDVENIDVELLALDEELDEETLTPYVAAREHLDRLSELPQNWMISRAIVDMVNQSGSMSLWLIDMFDVTPDEAIILTDRFLKEE